MFLKHKNTESKDKTPLGTRKQHGVFHALEKEQPKSHGVSNSVRWIDGPTVHFPARARVASDRLENTPFPHAQERGFGGVLLDSVLLVV